MKRILALFVLFSIFTIQTSWAQEKPQTIGFQGVAIDSKGMPVFDGNRKITFYIYDSATGDKLLWSEEKMIPIENGRFFTNLGQINDLDLPFDQPYWLAMRIDGGEELKPRLRLDQSNRFIRMTTGGDLETLAERRANAMDRDGADVIEGEPFDRTVKPNDQVILDDLIVDGSACIGFDCVNGESFGFDTIRIKENNLRIRGVDTSSSASFPSNDWQITFNDSANGGANKFSIDDIDGGRTPFTLEAGAPSHSLYVDDGGRLGLGTNTPVVDVHIKSGNTPTLRLEQDGSSGFTPQTWDVAGNEANFFIRDATNGSTLPFRIFPGAPSNALNIEASTGDVGLGITNPEAALHIFEGDLLLDNGQSIRFKDTGGTAREVLTFGAGGGVNFVANDQGNGAQIQFLNGVGAAASVVIATTGLVRFNNYGAGTLMTDASGNILNPSDVRLKNLQGTFVRGLSAILQLEPISYTWKEETGFDTENTYSGFSAQNVREAIPEAVFENKEGTLSLSDRPIIAALANAIKELVAENKATSEELEQARNENAGMKVGMTEVQMRLAKLEAFLDIQANLTPAGDNEIPLLQKVQNRVNEYKNGADENGRPKGSARPIQEQK